MKEVTGKIEWLADKPNMYQGQMQLSMKVNGTFYNFHDTEEKLVKLVGRLKKGFEVKLDVELNIIKNIEVISDKVEEAKKEGGLDDLTTFEELLSDAHDKFDGNFSVETEMISHDATAKNAVFKATVKVKQLAEEDEDGNKDFENHYQAYGDADQLNCGNMVKMHYLRMAETRAIARALRWATNNAKCSTEETEQGELTEEQMHEALEEEHAEEQTKP